MIDSVAIVSGGLDSVTLLHYLVKNAGLCPAVLTFKYGQKHTKEIGYAKYHAALLSRDEHRIVDLSSMSPLFSASALVSEDIAIPEIAKVLGDPQPITYVPNRNMIFLALAAAFAETHGVSLVYYGAQSHDMYGYWDTTSEFIEQLNGVLHLNRKTPIQIHAPFVNCSKADILRAGLEMGVDYGETWSCYEGNDIACGKCPTCAERLKAFEEVGVPDPLPYADGT
jgi:7-cyano-7-deazaguanine synthase